MNRSDANASANAANATDLPVAAVKEPAKVRPEDASAGSAREGSRKGPNGQDGMSAGSSSAQPPGVAGGVDDREQKLALQGTPDAKIQLKQQLEPRVFSGHASDAEVRLLISTCKDLGDKSCVQQARAIHRSE